MQAELDNIRVSAAGERDAAYFIDFEFAGHEHIAIIHDLRLVVADRVAQIDHLILTQFNTAWVIETKNLKADLSCNAIGEWSAKYAGSAPKAIASPTEQAKRHVRVLEDWLKANGPAGFGHVRPLVLVSSRTNVELRDNGPRPVPVVRSDLFGRWWRETHKVSLRIAWGVILGASDTRLATLSEALVKSHTPVVRNWPRRFGLAEADAALRPANPVDASVSTPFGPVYLKQVFDGRFALRHGDNDQLGRLVRSSATGLGQWNPRFSNWLIAPERVAEVVERLERGARS